MRPGLVASFDVVAGTKDAKCGTNAVLIVGDKFP